MRTNYAFGYVCTIIKWVCFSISVEYHNSESIPPNNSRKQTTPVYMAVDLSLYDPWT